jgi:putative SOS response-associated peptidase YedK
MCGRMALTLPHEALARLFDAALANDMPESPNYNVCPTQDVGVVTSEDGQRRMGPMRWGLIPTWYKAANGGPLLINARSETIAEKPAFRAAVRERRCIVPASGFYEWDRTDPKHPKPWYVTRSDGAPMAFAAVWQAWAPDREAERRPTVAVVTCAANRVMGEIHDRLPVILEEEDWALWLGEAGKGAARLMEPIADDALSLVRVSTEVNSSRAQGPRLIEPIDPAHEDEPAPPKQARNPA